MKIQAQLTITIEYEAPGGENGYTAETAMQEIEDALSGVSAMLAADGLMTNDCTLLTVSRYEQHLTMEEM